MAEPLISIDKVSFAYPGQPACLEGVSFEVRPAERVAVLGPNGSGKSTLLCLLDGLFFPASGRISVLGQELTERALDSTPFGPRFRSSVGFLFQSAEAQLFCPTVEEELAFGPLQLGWDAGEIDRRSLDVLKLLEIGHLKERTPQALSLGEKKRVALGALLILSPAILLLDEPTSGLDPRSQTLLLNILEGLCERGLTLLTATHDLELLPHVADRAIVLGEDHAVHADAPVGEVLGDTELLLRVNLIHAHSHRHGALLHSHPHQHVVGHGHGHQE